MIKCLCYFTGIRKTECTRRRRLGRNPRIPFSTEQVTILEKKFRSSPYLSNSDVAHLSKCLQLSESRVSKPIFYLFDNYLKRICICTYTTVGASSLRFELVISERN